MTNEKIKWHPAFAAAMQLELKEYKEHLEFLTEYQLTDEPLRIDIYDIKNTDIETQLIVAKELKDEEAKYLKLLQVEHSSKELIKKWIAEYIGNIKDPLYRIIMNVLTEANPNEILEVYKDMGIGKISNDNREFILEVIKKLELDKKLKEEGREEGIEEGREQGIEQGREQGIDIGEDRKAIKVAEKMIKRGDSVEDIVEITELPRQKVLELKNRLGF